LGTTTYQVQNDYLIRVKLPARRVVQDGQRELKRRRYGGRAILDEGVTSPVAGVTDRAGDNPDVAVCIESVPRRCQRPASLARLNENDPFGESGNNSVALKEMVRSRKGHRGVLREKQPALIDDPLCEGFMRGWIDEVETMGQDGDRASPLASKRPAMGGAVDSERKSTHQIISRESDVLSKITRDITPRQIRFARTDHRDGSSTVQTAAVSTIKERAGRRRALQEQLGVITLLYSYDADVAALHPSKHLFDGVTLC
jgi:hypothetical protein